MRTRRGKVLRGLLPALAIIAPATTLAVLGLRAYRAEALLLRERFKQDQAAIVRLVAGRLGEEARKALEELAERSRHRDLDDELAARFVGAHPVARHVFLLRGGQLVYPASVRPAWGRSWERRTELSPHLVSELDVRNYVVRLREQRRQGELVGRALSAEYRRELPRAAQLYRQASRGEGTPAAQALLGLARVARRQQDGPLADRVYAQLKDRFELVQDGEGTAYGLLADVGRAELGPLRRVLALHGQLLRGEYFTSTASRRFYLGWVLDRLDAASRRGDRTLRPEVVRHIRRQTEALFAADRFGTQLRRYGLSELQAQASPAVRGMALDRQTFLVLRRQGDQVLGYAVSEGFLGARVAKQVAAVGQRDQGLRLVLHRVGEAPRLGSEQLLHSALLEPPLGHWAVHALVPTSDPVGGIDRRSQMRQLGMIVGLIFVLAGGLFLTYRGVRRESDLAQLKSDFASNVSHELKTPLTSIRMYAEMLEQGIAASPEDQRRYQGVIIRESERLGRLIANVLDFSRIERGTRRYDLVPADLGLIAVEAIETFRRLSEGEAVQIGVELDEGLPLVVADREAAVQSILNLLSNAAKYSRGAPRIEVRSVRRADAVGVRVRDEGIGIPAGEQRRIFEDFYRAPQAREVGVEGTGLGLALVRRHMKACGGSVELASAVGQGSTFTLWFPLSPALPASQEVGLVHDSGH
ncbi:MAG: HAMP domain-containing histidine kinase [Deltaproteobacteria bacterium]|nr:HAMP domain-containing histidine kinase [Deltaproteobacteria bacterium]